MRYRLKTPELHIYDRNTKEPFEEFPQGCTIMKMDNAQRVTSGLDCKYAKHFVREKLWEAKINVVATNEKGDTLKTEQLFWDEKKEIIYTDQFVRLSTAGKIITGIGFEANQDLSDYDVKNIKGRIYVDIQDEKEEKTFEKTQ